MEAIDLLREHLEASGPNEQGEWGMYCPLHEDLKRSASINFEKGTFNCFACERGLTIPQLLQAIKEEGVAERDDSESAPKVVSKVPLPSDATISGWHSALISSDIVTELKERRGLSDETIGQYRIGWDDRTKAYTIPIFDKDGALVNVRRYQLDPKEDRRKIWSVSGHGSPTLYPLTSLNNTEFILLCEGEMDALLTLQQGFRAITRTGAADVWRREWNELFEDKTVFICHDMDDKGQKANFKIARELSKVANDVYIVLLPYEVTTKHGKDLSDYWLEGNTDVDFEAMVDRLDPWIAADHTESTEADPLPIEIDDVRIIDTLAGGTDRPIRVRSTVTGRKMETYLLPSYVAFTCDKAAGPKCNGCPMDEPGWDGVHEMAVAPDDVVILEMMDAATPVVGEALRKKARIHKCTRLLLDIQSTQPVEEFFVRPDVDSVRMSYDSGDYQTRKVVSAGNYDTMPNTTVELVGRILPHPRSQTNTFLVSEVNKTEVSIDNFELSVEQVGRLSIFQDSGVNPLRKCVEISRDLAQNVTHIFGRVEMHILMDLVFHSVLAFEFEGRIQSKGWLDALILGDTRTGKSEAAARLMDWYRVGEMVSCESASFAGIVGGLSQHAGREWVVQWGAVPLNDRRAIFLDEVSGLSHEEIASMSSIRSSGVAELTKIRAERTMARTRLCWMGNPRGTSMSHYTYGVQGIKPLIGNSEDIARFDLAMTLASSEVSSEEINREHFDRELVGSKYSSDACHDLVLWCWSRTHRQVHWAVGAQDLARSFAIELGNLYIDEPPLIQPASVRVKLARIAVAIAARTFSTDDGEVLLIRRDHVEAAFQLINKFYNMRNFGYGELSHDAIEESKVSDANKAEMMNMLQSDPFLAKFLRSCIGGFKSEDLADVLPGVGLPDANGVTQRMYGLRMVSKVGKEMKINPALRELLREDRRRSK